MAEAERTPSYRLRRPGGEIDDRRLFNAPGVVLLIAALTLIAYFLLVFAPGRSGLLIAYAASVVPARFLQGAAANGGVLEMLSPLIAHMFVHGGLMHLFLNLFWLLAFGTPVARRLGAGGALQSSTAFAAASFFVTFYFLSGVAGALAFIPLHASEYTQLVGASGGVSGLLGALVRFAFSRTTLFGPEEARFSSLTDQPVIFWTLFILAINNPIAVSLLGAMAGGAAIAWEAHLGGYFFGLLAYPFFERAARGFR